MARYYGKIGYALQKEIRPSVWEDEITEQDAFGEALERSFRFQTPPDQLSNNLMLNTDFEVVVDQFAIDHFSNMRYIVYAGTRWEITSVSYDYPRVHIRVGGVYNGPTPKNGCDSAEV